MLEPNVEAVAVDNPEAFRILQSRYPGISLLPAGISREVFGRVQYTVTFLGGGEKVCMVCRYGRVEFRRPDEEAYLKARRPSEVAMEVNRLADDGYCIVHQEVLLGVNWEAGIRPYPKM